MSMRSLRVLYFRGVTPLERAPFELIVENLKGKSEVTSMEVNDNHEGLLRNIPEDNCWIVARKWREAYTFLKANKFKNGTVFISALDLDSPRQTIHRVLAKKLFGSLPRNCTLLVHSPINYRFFGEMEKLRPEQLRYLPLPVSEAPGEKQKPDAKNFNIGTYTTFTSEGQLNFLAAVAHYVLAKNPNVTFRVMGSGPLYSHALRLGAELELGNSFTVTEDLSGESFNRLDGFIYCPLRNDHFIPLGMSSQLGLPTVATEMSGIEEYIQDGKTGFIVPVNETKAMGELLLRLSTNQSLSEQMGKKFKEHVNHKFSIHTLLNSFLETLIGAGVSRGALERAA